MEKQVIFLSGKKVNLRPYEKEKDLKNLVKWANDPDSRQFISTNAQFPMTFEREEELLKKKAQDKLNCFLIIETLACAPIGWIAIDGIDWVNRTASTGTLIGEKAHRGKGYGTDAKMILLHYAFNTLNLRKLNSTAHDFNKRSLAYNAKCGYKVEGIRKKQYFRNGKYNDEIIISVFQADFLKIWQKYKRQM